MNTEITDTKEINGWVFYDGDCRLCVRWARRVEGLLARRRFQMAALQTPWVRSRLGLEPGEPLVEMRLLRTDGGLFGGADALLELSRAYWWAWPFRQFARLPGVLGLLRCGYQCLARRRNCATGACAVKPAFEKRAIIPLVVLPLIALLFRSWLAPWLFMWAMAFALYAGCKWISFKAAIRKGTQSNGWRASAFLLAWPGMDAAAFLDPKMIPAKPRGSEWLRAVAKMLFGALLLWKVARLALPVYPLLAGWIGLTGMIFILHFGSFDLLSVVWRWVGVAATPLMQNPMASRSLAEFWGRRWNTAFNELAFRFTFRPLRRLTTPAIATALVFANSGLVHELVISVPARAGYGLPTLYFLIQGLGLIAERSWLAPRKTAATAVVQRLFTILVVAGPAFWLFHPPFVRVVILPMLRAIHAI